MRAADEVTVAKSSSPIRDAVLGELRDLVFRLSCVAGLIFGLLSALDSPAPPPSCARAEGCVGSVLAASMWPILGPALFGMLLGGLVGALLSRLIRSPRRRAVQLAGRWIRARYAGSCRGCGSSILPGDLVVHYAALRAVSCERCGHGGNPG